MICSSARVLSDTPDHKLPVKDQNELKTAVIKGGADVRGGVVLLFVHRGQCGAVSSFLFHCCEMKEKRLASSRIDVFPAEHRNSPNL